MTDHDDANSSPSTDATPEPVPAHERDRTPAGRWQPITLVIVLALLAALLITLGLWYQRQQQEQARWQANFGEVESQLAQWAQQQQQREQQRAERAQQQQALAAQMTALAQTVQEQLTEARQERQQLQQQWQQLRDQGRSQWALAETQLLLHQARQRARTGTQPQPVLALLQAAADQAAKLEGPGAAELRAGIDADIGMLEQVEVPDRAAIFADLQQLREQMTQLQPTPAQGEAVPLSPEQTAAESAPAEGVWGALQRVWRGLLSHLGQLVEVRRHDQPVAPLIAPEQDRYLQLQLQLGLTQAQTALIQGDKPLFTASLGQVRQWVDQYYRHDPDADAVLQRLDQLQVRRLAAELPLPEHGLAALASLPAEVQP